MVMYRGVCYVWGCMVMYRDVWLCIGVYGIVWGCMVMYRGVWLCMGVYGDV